jgi:hypothetical protein
MLSWRTQTNDPCGKSEKQIEKGRKKNILSMGIKSIRIEGDSMREMMNQVLYYSYMIPRVVLHESDPTPSKNSFIRHPYSQ